MKAELIMQSDLLDLIFDNRNKHYGAYSLRKEYNSRIYKSLAVIAILCGLFTVYALVDTRKQVQELPYTDVVFTPSIPVSEVKKETKAPANMKPAGKTSSSKIFLVDSTVIVEKISDSIQTVGVTGPIINIGEGPLHIFHRPISEGSDSVKGSVQVVTTDLNKPISNPDIMPEYPGGIKALRKFLERNLQNPDDMQETEVSVKVKFIVGYDGKLKGFEVLQDGGTAFNNEVIRVLKKMPDWNPGKSDGHNVSVYYAIPVKFVSLQ